jgi:23S rRNA pseudouridine1911/1915/1917 synthase
VPPPVRAVHRLDRETSGLMVFARTVTAERGLMQQFKRHSTHRRYLGVARGRVEEQTIDTFLARDRGDGRRGSTSNPNTGKRAVTHVRPIEFFDLGGDQVYSLVECRLETGRTHQIRIHLAERGHPLCGERVYQQPLFGKAMEDKSGAPRVALHAAELGFVHPISGEEMRFEMPLPRDLREFVERLRRAIEGRQ